METVNTEGPHTLLPVVDMLRPMINPMQSVNEEQENVSDRMMVDVDETAINNKNSMLHLKCCLVYIFGADLIYFNLLQICPVFRQ
jgi:hypothetical protein